MSQDTGQLAPGLADTAAAVKVTVASSESLSDRRQAEAGTFIREHGHDAMRHTPVTTDPRVKKGG